MFERGEYRCPYVGYIFGISKSNDTRTKYRVSNIAPKVFKPRSNKSICHSAKYALYLKNYAHVHAFSCILFLLFCDIPFYPYHSELPNWHKRWLLSVPVTCTSYKYQWRNPEKYMVNESHWFIVNNEMIKQNELQAMCISYRKCIRVRILWHTA